MVYMDEGYGGYSDFGGYGPYGPAGSPMMATGKGKDRSSEISVKVSNLPPGISSEDLREAFIENGIDTMTDVYIPLGKSYGFLRFLRMSEAQTALELSGCQFGDSEITCELAEGKQKSSQEIVMEKRRGGPPIVHHRNQDAFDMSFAGSDRGEVSLKVGNLPPDVSHEDLCEAFAEQGIDSMTDVYIPQGRRFGFLRFASAAEGKYAMQRRVSIRGHTLELEFAMSKKRNSEEMAGDDIPRRERNVSSRESREASSREAPDNPDVSADAPSIKVSNLPRGATSDELHQAFKDAGCRGGITDVYVPKGNRGFGFVRFENRRDADAAADLKVWVHDAAVDLEVAVAPRKGSRDAAGGRRHDDGYDFAHPPNGGYGCGYGMAGKGYGPAMAKGVPAYGYGKMGPYGGKGPKGYW
jgi:RNA recognition motif-containing protein